MQAKDITKPAECISEATSLREAVARMVKQQTNTLLVVGEGGVLVGELSVSDLLDAVIPENLTGDEVLDYFTAEASFQSAVEAAGDRLVDECMTQDFTAVAADDELIIIAATAIAHGRARIPVVDSENRPIGIISRQGLKQILARYMKV